MIAPTTTLRKISGALIDNPDAHLLLCPGGQGSGKTSAVLLLLINHALNTPGLDAYVASKELSKMKVTVIKTFLQIMKSFDIYDETQFKSGVDYLFDNGSHIRFLSLDRPGAYKGNRSDIVVIDEVNECGWNAYRELADRSKKVIAMYNPNFRSFCEDILQKLPDTVVVRTTFEDNEFCPENEKTVLLNYKKEAYNEDGSIKNQEFHRLWQVYGCGNICKPIGAVFPNWAIGEFIDTSHIIFGADFGSHDPSTLVKVAIDTDNKIIYIKELIYQQRLGSLNLLNLYKQVLPPQHLVIGDSASPMVITDLRQGGINILGCKKGKILDEVQKLQSYTFVVDPSSTHVHYEFDNYRFADSETHTTILPGNDHTIDAMRYAVMYMLDRNSTSSDEIIIF